MDHNILKCIFILSIICCQEACDLLNHPGNVVDLKVLGNGMHRKIAIQTKIMSKVRFSQCRLLYYFNIPKTMNIDPYNFNSTLIDHEFIVFKKSSAMNVYFIRKRPFLSSFELKDELIFPIHMNYPPADSRKVRITELKTPEIAVDCDRNQFDSCEKFTTKPDIRLKTLSKNWVKVNIEQNSTKFRFHGANINPDSNQKYFDATALIVFLILSLIICIY